MVSAARSIPRNLHTNYFYQFFSVNKGPKGLCSWDSSCLITLIKIAIVTGCSVCLLVQSYHCLNRYDDYETTATLAVKPTGEASFLSFTFCPNFHSAYDKEKLKQYGMNKRDLQNGIYRNTEKDKSHRILFEEVSFSLQDLLKYVQLGSWSPGNATLDFPVDGTLDPSLGQWSSKPHITYGYCHNLDVKNKAKNLGVSYLYVESYMGLYIYLHHDGQFLDYDSNSKVSRHTMFFFVFQICIIVSESACVGKKTLCYCIIDLVPPNYPHNCSG